MRNWLGNEVLRVDQSQHAAIEFSLIWNSGQAAHCDSLFMPVIDLRRDCLPGSTGQRLQQLQPGEHIEESFHAGELVEPWEASALRRIPSSGFRRDYSRLKLKPQAGRYYPRSVIAGAAGSDPRDIRPFRLVEIADDELLVDLNHPLAQYPMRVSATLMAHVAGSEQRGDSRRDIAGMLTGQGPGLQARNGTGLEVSFPLSRVDDNDDSLFYAMPRMVDHIDDKAVEILKSIYSRRVQPGSTVLDLMTSWTSHLDASIGELTVTGIGMNREELDANPLLAERLLQDLNRTPLLPFDDNSFDVVLCSLSVEYLTSPLDVFSEVRRVLKPGGAFINSFSERWFPTKVVTLWTEMHPFERVGMVLDYYIAAGFAGLQTESVRGHPRPANDRYRGMSPFSDPLYVVSGRKP